MTNTKITFLVSDTPGWTVGTKQGNSAFLDVGDKIEASEVVDSIIESLEEGRPAYAELGHLEQIDVAELGDPGAEERLAQLSRIRGTEVEGAEDEDPDPDDDDPDPDDEDPDPDADPAEDEDPDPAIGGGEGDQKPEDKRENAGGDLFDPSAHTVADVLTYLASMKDDAGEVERVKGLEAASSRGSTQVAAFEAGAAGS